jgi:predicted short-subunit dehydrogenase-like oxidoreductase (DUF2520 family)
MKLVFLGAGRLATQLAKACKANKHEIRQIYSQTEDSAKTLADLTGADYTCNLSDINEDADIYIYAVADKALENLISNISFNKGLHVHTAGSIPSDVFENHQNRYGVFYPFQTFSKEKTVDFSIIPILLETKNKADYLFLENFAGTLSNQVLSCSSDQRKAVHLSGVFACNFTNHMYRLAADIIKDAGLPFEILLPLIDETAAKVHEMEPAKAQTGPAIRYDLNVIEKHLSMLSDYPEMQELYELLSKQIHKM